MNDGIIKVSDIVLNNVDNLTNTTENKIHNVWKKVVSKIKSSSDNIDSEKKMSLGIRLASNTRVADLKNGVLLVEVDHSGWIQYLQIYQKFIIKGLKMEYPSLEINTLAFKQRGSNVKIVDVYNEGLKKSQEEYNKKLSQTENELNNFYQRKNEKKESNIDVLPEEMKEIFNRLIKQAEDEETGKK